MKKNKTKLDKFHKHESYDRVSIFNQMFYDYISRHPVIDQNKNYKKKAKKINKLMYELYLELTTNVYNE